MKQLHDYAKFFPPMEGEEFKALCRDVKEHGLINPIVLKDDKILDGRNRARACERVGVRPKYEEFKNGEALDYVISQNVLRRHLTPSQRAVLALELEKQFSEQMPKLKPGRKAKGISEHEIANSKNGKNAAMNRAAAALHIGPHLVQDAKRLARDYPDKIAAVRAGRVTVGEALTEARGKRAHEQAIRDKHYQAKKRIEKGKRQVAEYLDATKSFIVALKLADGDAELFSPEAARFVARRHDEIRERMSDLEKAIKKSGS